MFYLIQLFYPEQLSIANAKASVEALEISYGSLNGKVAGMDETLYNQSLDCLTRILYNEASGEPLVGKIYVAQVVINRTNHEDFPNTVCGVLKERNAFSFYNPHTKEKKRTYPKAYKDVAEKALHNHYKGVLSPNVVYFKVCSVESSFFSRLKLVTKVGSHCFFKTK